MLPKTLYHAWETIQIKAADMGIYMLKTTDRREISIFPSPQGNIKLPEGSKQHLLTDRRL